MPKSSLAAAFGASALAIAALPASAQTVEAVELHGLPTSLTVEIVGKDVATVRTEVRYAARTVCRNARTLGELEIGDFGWCAGKSAAKAMKVYRTAAAEGRLAANAPTIVLSAR
jgi:hypothetical protein